LTAVFTALLYDALLLAILKRTEQRFE